MARLVPLADIKVGPNRQRREFDESLIQELATSVSETPYGLQNPPVARLDPEGGLLLVSGERRLRAVKHVYDFGGSIRYAGQPVPVGMIPVTELGELDPIDAKEAELEENIRRVDLSVLEQAQATAELFDLRAAQAARDGQPKPTATDLAREIFDIPASVPGGAAKLATPRDTVKSQLLVAKHADNPEVRKATSLREAVKVIKKAEEAKTNAALAEKIGLTFTTAAHTLLQGDFRQIPIDEGRYQIILTDPPYGMGADEFGDSGAGTAAAAHFYEDNYEYWVEIMSVLPQALWRAAAPSAHAYLFCDIDRFQELRDRMSKAGWRCFRTPLIWHNPDGYRAPWPNGGPQRKYELILFATKGDRTVNRLGPDIIECRKDAALGHPAQKPVKLLRELLERSARPGDQVLDPFMGSGATIEAAHQLKLACTGMEKIAEAYGIAVKRVGALSAFDPALL